MKKILACALVLFSSAVSLNASAGGDIARGKQIVEDKKNDCASCHGAQFHSAKDPMYPNLAGQHQDYLEHALASYKHGQALNGRVNPTMAQKAEGLSGQDIKDVAAYLHSLPGPLVTAR